jgi:hypothetical protein
MEIFKDFSRRPEQREIQLPENSLDGFGQPKKFLENYMNSNSVF